MRISGIFLVFVLGLDILSGYDSSPSENLLNYGAVITGSSFAGRVNGPAVTIETDHYFDKIHDNDPGSGWMPQDSAPPYEFDFRWRVPVTISQLDLDAYGLEEAEFQIYEFNRFRRLVRIHGKQAKYAFKEATSDRFRLVIHKTTDLPALFELNLRGPRQLLPPARLPESGTAKRTVEISQVKICPEKASPGDKVHIEFKLKNTQPGDWLLVGFSEPMVSRFRWFVNDYRLTEVAVKARNGDVHLELLLPEYSPAGSIPLSVMAFSGNDKEALGIAGLPDNMPRLSIAVPGQPSPPPAFPDVKLGRRGGQTGFLINHEFRLPFFMRYCYQGGYERFFRTRENGINIGYFISTYGLVCPRDRWADHVALLDTHIRNLLRVRPEVYVMVGFDLRAHIDWIRSNHDALMLNRDGKIVIDSYSKFGLPSMGSEKYYAEAEAFLDYALDFFSKQPYAGRLIGYHPWACTRLDAFQGGIEDNNMVGDRGRILIGDYHPDAVAKFREFLRKKYGNDVRRLRDAWKRGPELTFENAMIDKMNLAAEDVPSGVFRDPVRSRPEIDYAEFFPTMIGNFHKRLAAHIKRKTGGRALVMLHYGALLSDLRITQPSGRRFQSNNFDIADMLEDDNIDMYVQAMPYETRNAGQIPFLFQPVASIALHNRLYLADYDIRTYTAGGLLYGKHRSARESEVIVQRDLASLLVRNAGAWISDMSQENYRGWSESGRAWFTGKPVVKAMRDTLNVFQSKQSEPFHSAAEIAVVVSSTTPKYEDILNAATIYRNLIVKMLQEELPLVAAPHDVILQSDLAKTDRKYKLYLFLNAYHLSPEERGAIEALKSDGRTLCFFYAPGYVTEEGFSVKSSSDLLGFPLEVRGKPERMVMRLKTDSPLSAGQGGRILEAKGYGPSVAGLHPEILTPTFQIAGGDVAVCGEWPDGTPALAAGDFGTHKIIYSAVPFFNRELLCSAARYAGVHLYCEEPVLMTMNRNIMILHNGYEKKRRLRIILPSAANVLDAFTGERVAEKTNSFEILLKKPDTRILRLESMK